jgi:hypothetical protein
MESDDQAVPLFKAKNLPDNSMQLREPVWITCIDFVDSSRLVTGTAYHQVNIFFLKFCHFRLLEIKLSILFKLSFYSYAI